MGGSRLGIIYPLDADVTNQGIEARFYLIDPATGTSFYYGVSFTTP